MLGCWQADRFQWSTARLGGDVAAVGGDRLGNGNAADNTQAVGKAITATGAAAEG